MNDLLIIAIILSASFFDGWRDNLIHRDAKVSWMRYHIVKWIAFYPALVYLFFVSWQGNTVYKVIVVALAYILWQGGERMSGHSYPSFWTKWITHNNRGTRA